MGVMRMLISVAFLLFVVDGIEETPCTRNQLPCDNGGCIQRDEWCDTIVDCFDGSDEEFCSNKNLSCLEHHMKCADGTCIPLGAKCDGYENCPDGSDEREELCENKWNPRNTSPGVDKMYEGDYSLEPFRKAEEWILSQRDENYGWGQDTPRAITTLFLINSSRYQATKEGNLMKKQLAIETTAMILKNATTETSLAKLACFVNSLVATCQDPRSFQGLDLVLQLRIRTSRKMSNATIPPLVFLTLCLTDMSIPEDFSFLYNSLNFSTVTGKMDLQSVTLMAMSCLAREKSARVGVKTSDEEMVESLAQRLAVKFQALEGVVTDVYTTALVIQALNTIGVENWDRFSALKRLMKYQDVNGNFGDILATYYAVPALLGESLLVLKKITCPSESQGWELTTSRQSQKEIKYELWLGSPVIKTHTMNLKINANWTIFDMMRYSAEKNTLFSLHYEETPNGPLVYSIASMPNDAERELQWASYRKTKRAASQAKEYSGLDLIPVDLHHTPNAGDNIVLWYRSSKDFNLQN